MRKLSPHFDCISYQLPADCLFVRDVEGCDGAAWEVESGKLLTDLGAPLSIHYTHRIVDPTLFDPLFVDAFAARVASEVAVSLTESVGKAQALWQVYQSKLAEARRRDAQEGSREDLPGGWSASRT